MTRADDIAIDTAPGFGEALDDRSIPIRPDDLASAMRADPSFGEIGAQAADVHDALASVIEMETGTLRRELDRLYAPHNPDRDTVSVSQQADVAPRLCSALSYAFDKANYRRLGDVDIDRAMAAAGRAGVKVKLNPEGVKSLQLFVRGSGRTEIQRRSWRAPIRGVTEELEVYRRLGVIVEPTDGPHLLLRLYRDIPVADLETLLPHAEVAMTWSDRLKIAFGGAGALGGIGTKIATGGLLMSPSTLAVPAAIAFGGLGVKSFLGYRRARRQRVSQRTHHLYNFSIASNAAVLHVLLATVTLQEINEAMLLYGVLASRSCAGLSDAKPTIEAWLHDRFGTSVKFDLDDAKETLDRLDLWRTRASGDVLEPGEACARLHQRLLRGPRLPYHLERAGLIGASARPPQSVSDPT